MPNVDSQSDSKFQRERIDFPTHRNHMVVNFFTSIPFFNTAKFSEHDINFTVKLSVAKYLPIKPPEKGTFAPTDAGLQYGHTLSTDNVIKNTPVLIEIDRNSSSMETR